MNHYTTIYIYDETDDSETPVPVVVEYREIGWREIEIDAIRADMPGEEPGPDISDTLDKYMLAQIESEIIRSTPWGKGRLTYYGSDVL